MRGQLSQEATVRAPVSAVWDVCRGLELAKIVNEFLPEVVGKIDVLEGDGGVNTVVRVTYPPGTPGVGYVKERFVRIDDEKRIKEAEVLEGEHKELGFDLYLIRLEIIEKDPESTIVKSSVEYELDDKFGKNASVPTTKPLGIIAESVEKYLIEKKNKPSA